MTDMEVIQSVKQLREKGESRDHPGHQKLPILLLEPSSTCNPLVIGRFLGWYDANQPHDILHRPKQPYLVAVETYKDAGQCHGILLTESAPGWGGNSKDWLPRPCALTDDHQVHVAAIKASDFICRAIARLLNTSSEANVSNSLLQLKGCTVTLPDPRPSSESTWLVGTTNGTIDQELFAESIRFRDKAYELLLKGEAGKMKTNIDDWLRYHN